MSFGKAFEYLKDRGYGDKVRVLDKSSATESLAAIALGVEEGRIAKTLSFKEKDRLILILLAGDRRIDNHKFKEEFHEKAHMLPFEETEGAIGHAPGGVCPFGVKDGIEIYLDSSLKDYETVFPAVGSANSAIELRIDDLESLLPDARWVSVSK